MRSRVIRLVTSVCVCVYVCMYMWTKKRAVWGLTTRKSSVSVIYCSLIEFNGAYYARQFVLGKKFGTILLTGRKKGPGKLYYSKPHFVYMQCSYAMLTTAERQQVNCSCADLQYCYRYSLYWQCLERTGYVFCGTLVLKGSLSFSTMISGVEFACVCYNHQIVFFHHR